MSIDYEVIRQKRKTVSIQIDNGRVIVKAPMRYPEYEIKNFIDKKSKWIEKHLEISKNKPTFNYKDGEKFHFLGKQYLIKIQEKSIQEKVILEDNNLLLFSHKNKCDDNRNKKILEKWFNEEANKLLLERYDLLFNLFDYRKKPELFIRSFKSRWGAYHKKFLKDYITLNKNLIMFPIECIDYVIVHELAHKTHQNHSKDFHNLVEEKYPDWKRVKRILDGR